MRRGSRAGVCLLLLVALLCAGAIAGCGGSDSSAGGSDGGEGRDVTTAQPPTEPGKPVPTESGAEAAKRPEPKVYVPDGPPPKKTVAEDMIEGSGPVAKKGDELAVNFIAVRYVNGEFFESSWEWPKPFDFTLTEKDVIPGWVQGLPGMREGGRRHLTIPGTEAARYGVAQSPEAEENSLVYVVDLIKVD